MKAATALACAILLAGCGTETGAPLTPTVESVTVLTTTVPSGTVGVPYSQTLQASGGTGTFTWDVASGTLVPGLSLTAAGVLQGIPTTAETGNFTARATSGGNAGTQVISVSIVAATPPPNSSPVTISNPPLPDGIIGTAYSQTLTVNGGGPTNVWSVLTGVLPPGLSLSTTGVISGTPTLLGTSNFTILVINGIVSFAQNFSITIDPVPVATPAVTISTTTLAGGTSGVAYSQTLAATGGNGTFAWSVTAGTLPAGLTLSSAGVLSGAPTTVGTSNFTVQVTSGTATATQALSITIVSPILAISTTTLPTATLGGTYTKTLQATGGTGGNVWTVIGGTLPAGIALSTGGALSGTPTTVGPNAFTVQVTSGVQTATQAYSLPVVAPGPVVISTTILPDAPLTVLYSQQLAASGGIGTYTWTVSAGAIPAGMVLTSAGLLTGTPTIAGTASFTVQATSGAQNSTQALAILVDPLLALTTSSLPNDTIAKPYNQTLTVIGGTLVYTWSVQSGILPPGLTMSASGVISGTPTTAGTYGFSIKVTSGTQIAARAYTVVIAAAAPVAVTTSALPGALATTPYSQALAASGGNGTYTWTVAAGTLPLGLSLSSAGVISGTPASTGVSNFTVQVSSNGTTATKALNITVTTAGVLVVTTQSIPDGNINVFYTTSLQSAGGPGVSTWTLVSGALPPGVTLFGNGTISGTPTHTGTFNFTVQATDGALTALKALSLVVDP